MRTLQAAPQFDRILEILNLPRHLDKVVVTGAQLKQIVRGTFDLTLDPSSPTYSTDAHLGDHLGVHPAVWNIPLDEEVTLTRN
ncbi:MAG: hypothetical protein RL173_1102 [Fibrobacterota bacterium]|jgi:hypothetical protein